MEKLETPIQLSKTQTKTTTVINELESILGDEVDVSQPLFGGPVFVLINFLHDGPQIHRLPDYVVVVWDLGNRMYIHLQEVYNYFNQQFPFLKTDCLLY